MTDYNHKDIEGKWQKLWEEQGFYRAETASDKKKFYALVEFPYPSGDGLHMGHPRSYIGLDILARKRRAEGYNVLYPIGWDAFGLPTENYAIKTGRPPQEITKENTDTFRRQIKSLGISFDWSREINTTDPKYYKWTQWIFLQLFKKGLAYKNTMPINWCTSCKIGLANEEVVAGACERCGGEVETREKEQWVLKITDYAERLYDDLDDVHYLDHIKTQQRNWIGKSKGAELTFEITGGGEVKVFTTRPDTLFGATYVTIAPEHPLLEKYKEKIENYSDVSDYAQKARAKKDIERTAEGKEKTGVKLEGISAINPATKKEVPIFVADYVLPHYGTGAIMAVPAHDVRDYEFAKKFDLPTQEVVVPNIVDKRNPPVSGKENVERRNVHAIVKDPKTGKYLGLKWKKFDWLTFPMGGVEEGEDAETAARREVEEETGYTNLTLIEVLEGSVRAEYFAAHKDQNRTSYTQAVVFELAGDEHVPIDEEEKAAHDIVWLNKGDLHYSTMTHAEIEMWQEKMNTPHGAYAGEGLLINSGEFNGLTSEEAREKITESVDGEMKTTFKLRDWVFSRQRYWGEPIPMIHCEKCGWVPVPESDLPVELPHVEKYEPTDDGESPLASIEEWVSTSCPSCEGPARRETDVMPNWAGSSWYYLRYTDPENESALASKESLEYWTPVDWYNGGMEHTTLHLLYSRFWHKFLFDIGITPTKEPYTKRTSHGLILAEGGEKMSKSKGNVINPDEIVSTVGADTLRVYEMFMGPFDEAIAWSMDNIAGSRRFLEKVWNLKDKVGDTKDTPEVVRLMHETIQKVGSDIEEMRFNTAVSALMIYVNALEKEESVSHEAYEALLKLLAPFAPHITEELWAAHKEGEGSIHTQEWPVYDEKKIERDEETIVVQVNGKVRAKISVSKDASEDEIKETALKLAAIEKWLEGEEPKKVIYVKGRLLSLVV